MQLLYWLESIRTPALDSFFSLVTHLGSETVFLAVAIVVFWCVSKKSGYYLMTVGFFGTLLNQFLKLSFRIPRPWMKDPGFTIVEAARADATGYSFPSGHTQSAATVFGCPARSSKKGWVRGLCLLAVALTALSRMYLGVHTPLDVGVSLALGAVLVFVFYPVFEKSEETPRYLYVTVGALTLCALAYVIYVETKQWPADIDVHNLEHGVKNGYLLFGCGAAMLLSYYVEKRYVNFDPRGPLKAQILKVMVGLAIVLALKAGLKPILNPLFGGHIAATALRYFLLVVFAACVWPLSFPWFVKGCPMPPRVKKILRALVLVIVILALLAAVLFWLVTRETKAAPIATDGASNPLITPLGTTMLSGHRAGGGVAPENTMLAVKNCVESDAYRMDVFEFDIHLTSDGVLVLLHDSTLDRTSNAAEHFGEENVKVGSKTFAQLKELNMGEKFVSDSGEAPFTGLRGEDIPEDLHITSLEEALEYLESKGEYHYIIEVKNDGAIGYEAVDKLYELLCDFDCLDRTVVGTFHNEITAYMDEMYPELPRSAGFNECIKFYICSFLNLPLGEDDFGFVALQIPTTDYVVNLGTSRVVNYAHTHDIAVQYWTINDPAEMARLQSIGADTIMTDVPDQAAGILAQP